MKPILCVTANAAIDHSLLVPNFVPGEVYRSQLTLIAAGGKGVNVARAIRILGGEAIAGGFLAGTVGKMLEALAAQEGIPAAWTWLNSGETRICTIIADPESGEASVINEMGPSVTDSDWQRLQADIVQQAAVSDVVCLSGSLPRGSSQESFSELLRALRKVNCPAWVDTSGASLRTALDVKPNVIKINHHEIGEVLNRPIPDAKAAAAAAHEICRDGIEMVAVTMGKAGAVLVNDQGAWYACPPKLKAVDAVGSGDVFLSGLVHGRNLPSPDALRQAVAASAANILSLGGGLFEKKDFETILPQVTIETL